METESKKPREEKPAPSLVVRLAWWFGIYMAGQIPLMIHGLAHGIFFLIPFIFPLALGDVLAPFVNLLPEFLGKVMIVTSFFAGFAFYGWHLYATLKVTSCRRFDFLLIVLVIVVLVNQWILTTMVGSISG
jgi:hypothetical protein